MGGKRASDPQGNTTAMDNLKGLLAVAAMGAVG